MSIWDTLNTLKEAGVKYGHMGFVVAQTNAQYIYDQTQCLPETQRYATITSVATSAILFAVGIKNLFHPSSYRKQFFGICTTGLAIFSLYQQYIVLNGINCPKP